MSFGDYFSIFAAMFCCGAGTAILSTDSEDVIKSLLLSAFMFFLATVNIWTILH